MLVETITDNTTDSEEVPNETIEEESVEPDNTSDEEEDSQSDDEARESGGIRLSRELRALGTTMREDLSREVRNLHTNYNPQYSEANKV